MTSLPLRSRRPVGALVAPCALGLVLLGTLAACGDDDSVAIGDVVPASGQVPDGGTETSVTVPTGTLTMVISQGQEMGLLQAPDDGTLLRLSTAFLDGRVRRDVWSLAARAGTAEPVELAVQVGDTEYPVGMVRRGSGAEDAEGETVPSDLVLAVDGELEDLDDVRVEVTYDGQEQVVSAADGEVDAGAAEPLYDEVPDVAALPTAACGGSVDDPAITADVECEVGSVRQLPYVPGQGWAEEGRTWTVVAVRGQLTSIRSAATDQVSAGSYVAAGVTDATSLEGAAPVAVLDEDVAAEGTRYYAQLIFDTPTAGAAPTGALDVSFAYGLSLQSVDDGPGSPEDARRVTYTASVDLADLAPSS